MKTVYDYTKNAYVGKRSPLFDEMRFSDKLLYVVSRLVMLVFCISAVYFYGKALAIAILINAILCIIATVILYTTHLDWQPTESDDAGADESQSCDIAD